MSGAARDEVARLVPRGTLELLERYVALLQAEASRQNLVAPSTLVTVWERHILDSLQLLALARSPDGLWVDIGSGAGLPGLVVALASDWPMLLIEPRRLRAAFLADAADALGVGSRVTIRAERVEAVALPRPAGLLSARAVAPLARLFAMAAHLAGPETRWLLPKGRTAADQVAEARRTWQGDFRLVPSLTDSAARVVEATQVRRKGRQ